MSTTRRSTKAPTKREIESNAKDDLREVYLLAFDQFAITPTDVDVATTGRINVRYARELLGVLVHERLLAVTDVNGDGDVWQVVSPGTYDEATREEAESTINEFLDRKIPSSKTNTPKESKMTATATTATTATRTRKVKNESGKCLCGCGANSTSNYRPGHDARHAGQIARTVAATGDLDSDLFATLPSEPLRDKAMAMAERIIAKRKPVEARVLTVKAKVGRTVYEGSLVDGVFHYVDAKHNEKQATKFTVIEEA